jgi:hypothetical protein
MAASTFYSLSFYFLGPVRARRPFLLVRARHHLILFRRRCLLLA